MSKITIDDNTAGVVEIDHRNVSHDTVHAMGRIESWAQEIALLENDLQANIPNLSYQDYLSMHIPRLQNIIKDLQVRLTRISVQEGSATYNQIRDVRVD